MRVYVDDKFIDCITSYKNFPQLPNQISDEFMREIISQMDTQSSGSASIAIVCLSGDVYYLTQCPAKLAMATICDEYPTIAPQLEPIGNYKGQFNVFKTTLLRQLDWYSEKDSFGNELDSLMLEFVKAEYIPTYDCKLRPYWDLAKDIINIVAGFGFSADTDIRWPNFLQKPNGDIILVDPVWVNQRELNSYE